MCTKYLAFEMQICSICMYDHICRIGFWALNESNHIENLKISYLVCIAHLPVAAIAVTEFMGHGPAVIVPWEDLGPTNVPLSVPPVMILYTIVQFNPSSFTLAIPLVIGAIPTS